MKPDYCDYCKKAHWGACTSNDLRAAKVKISKGPVKSEKSEKSK